MALLPLRDGNPLQHIEFQWVTLAIIVLCVLGRLLQSAVEAGQGEEAGIILAYGWGAVPSVVVGRDVLGPDLYVVPAWVTLISYAFLHGDLIHLAGNMLFLHVFGDNVEDAMGHLRFLVFYLLCAVGGALVHVAVDPASQIPMIGASGAVSGVLGAYLVLHPRQRVWVLVLMRLPLRVPAWFALGGWFAFQLAGATVFADPEASIAYWAHVGGFVLGVLLVVPFRRRGTLLFGPPR